MKTEIQGQARRRPPVVLEVRHDEEFAEIALAVVLVRQSPGHRAGATLQESQKIVESISRAPAERVSRFVVIFLDGDAELDVVGSPRPIHVVGNDELVHDQDIGRITGRAQPGQAGNVDGAVVSRLAGKEIEKGKGGIIGITSAVVRSQKAESQRVDDRI